MSVFLDINDHKFMMNYFLKYHLSQFAHAAWWSWVLYVSSVHKLNLVFVVSGLQFQVNVLWL